MTSQMADRLLTIAVQPMGPGVVPNGLYIPPSCFLPLIQAYARTSHNQQAAQQDVELLIKRLRTLTVPLSQLPLGTLPFPEPRPSIEYLQQLTHFSGGFFALVQAGSINDGYAKVVSCGTAEITIIAANRDRALTVEPVELRAPAVPGFLKALSWALPHLASKKDKRDLYNQFIVAASILLVVACDDLESREKIAHDPGRTKLITELRDSKEVYLGMIPNKEWERLVNGLALGEFNAEETRSDEESDKRSDETSNEAPAVEPKDESDDELIKEPTKESEEDTLSNSNKVTRGNIGSNEAEDSGANTFNASIA
ncbi:unnamed protein product [Rhizoctonia solani]|uniref:Uncharacterized protein n=1 Tax=Rhizoctonia solani TaxID=456999 RepID=A0A8H2XY13_9AGAM|nr:unnamed protein product [Rhizoctonia solani]